jgi:hypothetical protein
MKTKPPSALVKGGGATTCAARPGAALGPEGQGVRVNYAKPGLAALGVDVMQFEQTMGDLGLAQRRAQTGADLVALAAGLGVGSNLILSGPGIVLDVVCDGQGGLPE